MRFQSNQCYMRFIIVALVCLLPSLVNAHQTHISVTNIDINDTIIRVQIKLAEHDLIHHLNEVNKTHIKGETYINNPKVINNINEYIKSKLQISINNNQLNLKYNDIRLSDHNLFLSYTCKLNKPIKTIQIINKLLLESSVEQKNLVIIKFNESEQGIEFNNSKWEENIEF